MWGRRTARLSDEVAQGSEEQLRCFGGGTPAPQCILRSIHGEER
jgi:hypothetical protein